MSKYYLAPTDAEAEIHLRRAEDWDDVRMWIDGLGDWRVLRRRTELHRLIVSKRHVPFVGLPTIEGGCP